MNNIRRRIKRKGFTSISNEALDNPVLSLKAKGLLAIMLSQKEGWVFYLSELMQRSSDGRTSFDSAMKELCDLRYVVKARVKSTTGRFAPNEYIFDDVPLSDQDVEDFYEELAKNSNVLFDEKGNDHCTFSAAENPSTENPQRKTHSGKHATNNTKENKTDLNNTNETTLNENSADDNFTQPKSKTNANPGRGKSGSFSPSSPQSPPSPAATDSPEVARVQLAYNAKLKENKYAPESFSPNSVEKMKAMLPIYGVDIERIEEYIDWLWENYSSMQDTNDYLKKFPYPPFFLINNSMNYNKYFKQFLKGEKVDRGVNWARDSLRVHQEGKKKREGKEIDESIMEHIIL